MAARGLSTLAALIAAFALVSPSPAQEPEAHEVDHAPGHQHYAEPEGDVDQPAPDGRLAPRLQDLGSHTFPAETCSEEAGAFVAQGVNLAYGFNHAEAGRSFREAARLDPGCVLAYWGEALVLGPNINAPMDPEAEPEALELARKAVAFSEGTSERERALIDALAVRYTGDPDDRAANDAAYASAMAEVAGRFPDDLDVATLYVESMMDLRPWSYWMPDGTPYEGTERIVGLIESILERNPDHPGALHLYIHLMEALHPERAEEAADRLLPLMPGAGHIVHMPSHIYQRVGRYADAARANELAIAADEDYISQCRAQGLYPMAYYPHNVHFLWFAATMEGRGEVAVDAARKVASGVDDATLAELPLLAGFRVVPYYALTRFGRWDEMLAEPPPPAGDPFLTGMWHYARGMARVAKGELDAAEEELAAVEALVSDPALDYPMFSPNTAADIAAIAPHVLGGELAAARGEHERAIPLLERAVRLEDGLVYTEPSEWHFPPRHALAAALLDAGRPDEAETVYWQDLARHPENGWALSGLARALRAQGEDEQAAVIDARFAKAWERADVVPSSSRWATPAPADAPVSGSE
jgi:tetratricopeptide (TPR) repeat protein